MTATRWLHNRKAIGGFLGLVILGAGLCPTFAGDSLLGTVTEVKSAELVTLDYGAGQYVVRLIGIEAPREAALARQAAKFLSDRVLNKKVQMRFDHRAKNGEMVSRLLTEEPAAAGAGGRDLSVELVRAGLARRQKDYDYKYGELAAAEAEAQKAARGLWAAAQPR